MIGKSHYFEGRLQGLEQLLNNHLVECRERYQAYIKRHDDLSAQVAANDRHRTEQLDEVRADLNDSLDEQTQRIAAFTLKVVGGVFGMLVAAIGALLVWLMKAHGWG
jgi:hypothetical protein